MGIFGPPVGTIIEPPTAAEVRAAKEKAERERSCLDDPASWLLLIGLSLALCLIHPIIRGIFLVWGFFFLGQPLRS